jgi:cell division protein FtsX
MKDINKTVLFSVSIFAVTAIIITVLLTGGEKASKDPVKDLQAYFEDEHGVEVMIDITVHSVSENQAQTITKKAAKDFGLGAAEYKEYEGSEWYSAESDTVSVSAFYD